MISIYMVPHQHVESVYVNVSMVRLTATGAREASAISSGSWALEASEASNEAIVDRV